MKRNSHPKREASLHGIRKEKAKCAVGASHLPFHSIPSLLLLEAILNPKFSLRRVQS